MRYQDQAVLVTGGASGIGREVCLQAAREGARVAIGDRDFDGAQRTASAIRATGAAAQAFALDVTDPASVNAFVAAAETALGRLDVLVNSAGVREIVAALELMYEEWSRVIGINLTGTFLPSQAFARRLTAAGKGGRIVNLASVAGLMAAPKRTAYVSSKHGVVGLTKQMALELGELGIRVNAVAPGVVRTAMTESYFHDPATTQLVRDVHALGRWAEADEVANAILFLAAPENSFITGTILTVDGGFTAGKKI